MAVKCHRGPAEVERVSTSHCPSCHAAVMPDALWCTLCHLDLRPPEVAVVTSAPERRAMVLDPVAHTRGQDARDVRWPCAQCDTENDLESTTCATCGSAFLGGLQSDNPTSLRLPLVGNVSNLGRGTAVAIAIGVAVVFTALLSVVLALTGSAL